MKKLIIIILLLPLFSFSQNQMINKKMDMEMKNKYQSNSFQIMKKVENRIINKWEEYSRAFEGSKPRPVRGETMGLRQRSKRAPRHRAPGCGPGAYSPAGCPGR